MAEPAQAETNVMDVVRGMVATMELDESKNKDMSALLEFLGGGGALAEAHGLNKKDLEVIYNMALTCYNNSKHEDARTLFKFLCMMDHASSRWWMGLGAANQMLKNYAEAVKAYGYCTLLDVENPKPQLQAGYCLMSMGNDEAAVQALEGALMVAGSDRRVKTQAEALLSAIETRAGK